MNSGIRSAASQSFNCFPANGRKCFIQNFLNGIRILLGLPAVIGSAIICNFYEVSLWSVQGANVKLSIKYQVSRIKIVPV